MSEPGDILSKQQEKNKKRNMGWYLSTEILGLLGDSLPGVLDGNAAPLDKDQVKKLENLFREYKPYLDERLDERSSGTPDPAGGEEPR